MVMVVMMVMMVTVSVIGIVRAIRVPAVMMMVMVMVMVLRQLYIRQLLWLPVVPRRAGFRRIDSPEKSNCIGYGLKQLVKRARTHHLGHAGSPRRGCPRGVQQPYG